MAIVHKSWGDGRAQSLKVAFPDMHTKALELLALEKGDHDLGIAEQDMFVLVLVGALCYPAKHGRKELIHGHDEINLRDTKSLYNGSCAHGLKFSKGEHVRIEAADDYNLCVCVYEQ